MSAFVRPLRNTRELWQTFGRGNAYRLSCSTLLAKKRGLATGNKEELKKTCLHDFHLEHGAKMVPFCGWSMPVQYSEGVIKSHLHVREQAAIFDVSHMLQFKLLGKDRVKFLESLVVADIEGLAENTGTLSLFTNENGGIKDDLIINKKADELYVVSNAGCADKITAHLIDRLNSVSSSQDVGLELLEDKGLIALQGPKAAHVLQGGVDGDLSQLTFMNGVTTKVFGIKDVRITRCGYTGEDGFELSVNKDRTVDLCNYIINNQEIEVQLAGLGARDTLRLEAGLCLYGNDIDEDTTPSEAVLVWTIGKKRRQARDFPGAEIILKQIKDKPKRKRIGLISTGAPARGGTKVIDEEGNTVGQVTSGCPSPSLKQNVAMAYVDASKAKIGTPLQLEVYKKKIPTKVVKMPFVSTNYYFGN